MYFPFGAYRAVGNINGTYDYDANFPDVFYTFTGQEDDDDLGFYNYGARLYDPVLGRFISADSMVPDPNDPQSFNRYSYTLNNPLRYIDPTGNQYDYWDAWYSDTYSTDLWAGSIYNPRTDSGSRLAGMSSFTNSSLNWSGSSNFSTSSRFSLSNTANSEINIWGMIKNAAFRPADATMIGANFTAGMFAALNGGIEMVVNHKSGEVSLFYYGGFEGGMTSYGINAKMGSIWNLDRNDDYKGPFVSGNLGYERWGVSGFATSDQVPSYKIANGPYGFAGNYGRSFLPFTASMSTTQYKQIGGTIPYVGYILPLLSPAFGSPSLSYLRLFFP